MSDELVRVIKPGFERTVDREFTRPKTFVWGEEQIVITAPCIIPVLQVFRRTDDGMRWVDNTLKISEARPLPPKPPAPPAPPSWWTRLWNRIRGRRLPVARLLENK